MVSLGTAVVYLSVFGYSAVNYAENVYFGLTTVGNVNYFGKILQYNMEDLGSNEALKEDIRYAFKTEKPEFKVNGKYLEPWHFVGTYGWAKGHYRELGRFSKEIIMNHPIRYITESIKLTYQLFVLNSPFNDFIAVSELQKAGRTHPLFKKLRTITESIDLLYILLIVCLLEVISFIMQAILQAKSKKASDGIFFTSVIMVVILYHYAISAFFSYGDYCRLLAPCYPLIYAIISLYIYRFFSFIYLNSKLIIKLNRGK